jgi:hypothetical protein
VLEASSLTDYEDACHNSVRYIVRGRVGCNVADRDGKLAGSEMGICLTHSVPLIELRDLYDRNATALVTWPCMFSRPIFWQSVMTNIVKQLPRQYNQGDGV